MEIHQKKAGPDNHRLKTMVKRRIEQDLRNRNFGARNGNYERNAVVKNQGTKQRVQRILGDCWQCETNGQCSKGDNCSFRHDINKRAKLTQPNPSPSSSTRQKERKASRTRSPRGKSPLQNACSTRPRVVADLGKRCYYAHRQDDEQPSKRSKKNDDKSAVAMLKKYELHDRTGHDRCLA